jgi:hypothetical protein
MEQTRSIFRGQAIKSYIERREKDILPLDTPEQNSLLPLASVIAQGILL